MSDILYFDCYATLGQQQDKQPRARWSTEHLLEDMELAEIAGALVVHGVAQSYEVMYGNERLKQELSKAPGKLFGAWCIVPIGEPDFFKTGDEMLRAMEAEDIRAVRIMPGGFSLHYQVMGYTFEVLQHYKILTILEVGWGGADVFSFFHDVLSLYPRLPVLLINQTWAQQRHIHRLMELHENLHIEFSAYQINRGLEKYTEDFGDERLLFGTGMTSKSPGAARAFVDYAQIPDESKRRIAGGNLKRLLKGQGPEKPAPRRREDDPIVDEARAGRPQSVPVLDSHVHGLHEGGQSAGIRYLMYDGDAEGMMEVNRWCGIDRMAMMSWNGPVCCDAKDGNEVVWRAMQRLGDKIIGVASMDPCHMTQEEIAAEIRLRYLEQKFVGMKPYCRTMSYEDDEFAIWWEFGNEHRLYCLMDVNVNPRTGVAGVGRLAERFPEMSWLIPHSGQSWPFAESVAACIQSHPNVYAEITYTAVTNRCVEYLVEATDEDHVIFGTDVPMRDPRQQLGWVLWADLPVDTRKKILAGNFQRILDRVNLP